MPQKPKISIVAAVQKKDNGIGKENKLLFRIPDDLKRFKMLTQGHPIIMGRKTYESIGRPLPNRTNIVVSTDPSLAIEGCVIAHSPEEALEKAKQVESGEIFIIGGFGIYKAFLPLADTLHLTLIEGELPADTFFPDYSEFSTIVSEERKNDFEVPYTYLTLERNH